MPFLWPASYFLFILMKRYAILFTVASFAIGGVFPFSVASAQSVAGIKIQPTLIEQKVTPGDTSSSVFRVTNLGQSADTFYVTVRDVSSILPNGTPQFATSSADVTGLEISSWIQMGQQSVTLKPNETKEISFSIKVPSNATPGAHIGGVVVATQPPNLAQTGTAVSYGATAIVSLQVGGDIVDTIQVREFRTDKSVYNKPNVTFIARIENTGNTLIKPRGPIEVADMWGKKVATIIINDDAAGILPNSVREFKAEWKGEGFTFGRYQVLMSLGYGSDSKNTITEYTSFWVLPANIIISFIVGLLALMLVGYVTVRTQVRRKISEMSRIAGERGETVSSLGRGGGMPGSFILLYRIAMAILVVAVILLVLVYFT